MSHEANPLHILLIEDDEHDRAAFQRTMQRGHIDCRLTVCERAEEAENLLTKGNDVFNLVVLDYDLPGMNGLDFFIKMKRREDLPPFVMLTRADSENLSAKALQAGIYDYVVKDAEMGYLNQMPMILTAVVQRHDHDRARRAANAAIKKSKDELESRVRERTAELAVMVQALENEIKDHRQTEIALKQSQAQLRELSRKILEAQETERKFVAREIHDSISGSLAAIKFALEEKLDSMGQNPSSGGISLEKIISQVDETIKESRRISAHLRPSLLDDLGLLATIAWFCRETEKLYPQIQFEQQLDVAENEIPEMLKVVVYRVLQEAVTNVAKHSGASRVRMQLTKIENRIKFSVADNGCGFDPAEKFSDSTGLSGYGLSGMRDRTLICDGKFEVTSEKGKGTTVHISLPVPS